jgi:AcrR family transcriptional regulator
MQHRVPPAFAREPYASSMTAGDVTEIGAAEGGLSQRKRDAVRAHLSEVALDLLTDRDFDSVTVDEIATAAGISRRTFFRYFPSKEEVILGFLDRVGERLREEIIARPAHEPPVVAVHAALRPQVDAYVVRADRTLALVRLLQLSPSLRARELESRQRLREKVADAIGRRLGLDHHTDMRPRLLAGIALVPLDVAITMWMDSLSGESVHAILSTSIATLAGALAEMHSPRTAPHPHVWRSHE